MPDGTESDAKGAFQGEKRRILAESDDDILIDKQLEELEQGCRTLRRAMQLIRDNAREQVFYQLELRARRSKRSTPLWEKAFSYLYDLTSSSGTSIARPLFCLTALLLVFAGLFLYRAWLLSAVAINSQSAFWDALAFSWDNAFRPFSALSDRQSLPLINDLLTEHGAAVAFGVRAFATAESILSIMFIFLVGLAARRRFQISN